MEQNLSISFDMPTRASDELEHILNIWLHSEPVHHGQGLDGVFGSPNERQSAVVHCCFLKGEWEAAGVDQLTILEATIDERLAVKNDRLFGEIAVADRIDVSFHCSNPCSVDWFDGAATAMQPRLCP
jgi:hypothetical protein